MPDDLDSFLQRAAQQRQKRKQAEIVILEPASPASSAPPPLRQPAPPPQQAPTPTRPLAPPTRPLSPPAPPPPVVVVAEPVSGDDIAAHVATHLSNREFEQRASHLGERVGLADDSMASHLQQVFDHQVGSIGKPATARLTGEEQNAANMSLEVLATFRDPTMLRRAIILNEVLTPPKHRW